MKKLKDNTGNKFIFLHIPKTAGTTLKQVFHKNFGDSVVDLTWAFDKEDALKKKVEEIPKNILDSAKLIQGHFPFGIHNLLDDEVSYLSIVRDPVERLISRYFHLKRTPHHRLYKMYNGEFPPLKKYILEEPSIDNDNNQTRVIAGATMERIPLGSCDDTLLEQAKENIKTHFIAMGVTELFDQFLIQLKMKNVCQNIYYTKLNRGVNRPKEYELDSKTLDFIRFEKNKLDYELYLYVKANFANLSVNEIAVRLKRFQKVNRLYYYYQLPRKAMNNLLRNKG